MSQIIAVVGGQFGSEGKGGVAAHIVRHRKVDICARVAGPNAGHTAYDDSEQAWALRQIPVAAVADPDLQLVIAAGSEIDTVVLNDEIKRLEAAGIKITGRLAVDGTATIIDDVHKQMEADAALTSRLGSTAKGIGAARAERLYRRAKLADDVILGCTDTSVEMQQALGNGGVVMIEGTQGFGLGLHAGYYPFCTSSDCRAIDFMAMCGLSPWSTYRVDQPDPIDTEVWVVLRTYPIRVAGNSGPLMNETSWDELGFAPEHTTVTQKVRRVGGWDSDLAFDAVQANGGSAAKIALTFFDYWYPELAGARDVEALEGEHLNAIDMVQDECGATVGLITTGPNTCIWLEG